MSCYIGIDLGGTSIKGGRIEFGKMVRTEVLPVDTKGTQQSIFNDICKLINKLLTREVKGIGFAVPAVIDFASGTTYGLSNIPQFNGFAIQKALGERFPVQVMLQNDANCFVLGEKYFGAGQGFANIVGLITGTGTGAGIIVNNKIHNGEHLGAGELGMIPYKESCFESYCSGQFFTSQYHVSGEELSKKALVGDKDALSAFYTYGLHLGELINLICYVLDPQIIIIGGSVSKSFELYKSGLETAMKKFYFDHQEKVIVKPSILKDIAIFGAVSLFCENPDFA
jgi:glucokinase